MLGFKSHQPHGNRKISKYNKRCEGRFDHTDFDDTHFDVSASASFSDNKGCCDSSQRMHATNRFKKTGHPVMAALPNRPWKWCYVHKTYA